MIAATTLALLCLTPPQENPKWDEVLSNMHRDIRSVKGVYEEWTLQGTSKDGETSGGGIRRWMDGKRFRQEMSAEGQVQLAMASDGAKMWTAVRPAGCYVWHDVALDPVAEKWEGLGEESKESQMSIGFSNAYDVVVRISPRPTVTKFEEVDGERRVTAVAKVEDREMNFVMHFEREKWLLKEIEGKASSGPATLSFRRTKAQRDQTFESDVFALDAKIVEGLKELTGTEKEEFLKALKGGE